MASVLRKQTKMRWYVYCYMILECAICLFGSETLAASYIELVVTV